MENRVTSSDVAKEAGVSRATVSYVLNNITDVKIRPETRERVLAAARRLNYYPHSIARALKTDKSMSIGVVSRRNIADDRFSIVLRGIKDGIKEGKYSITLCSDEQGPNNNKEYINYFLAKRIDGLILLSAEEGINSKDIQDLIDLKIPTVLLDYHFKTDNVHCIDIDYFHGGYIATKNLLQLGYNKIIYFAPDINIAQEKKRLNGVRTAIKEAGEDVEKYKEVISGKNGSEFTDSSIYMLKNRDKYTAVIVSWIEVAYKVLSEAHRLNISIPEDLAVISLAGSFYANLSYPKLSTCDLPLYDLGYRSGKVLVDSINKKLEIVQESLPCILKLREST